MHKSTKIIAWIFYGISVVIALTGVFVLNHTYTSISLASLILLVPWIICIVDSIRSGENTNGLWIFILVFFGFVTIPFWLAMKNNKTQHKK
jgi:hypothetical protein